MPVTDPQDQGGSEIATHIARLVAFNSYRQRRGMLASEKMRGPVFWTTDAQKNAMILFELHDAVTSYSAWPITVPLVVDGLCYEYRPALGLTMSDGRKVAVVLVRSEDQGTARQLAFDQLLIGVLASVGFGVIFMPEDGIRNDPRLKNARAVMRSSGWAVGPAEQFQCVRLVTQFGGSATIGQLAETGPSGRELSCVACVLAMRRILLIDLRAPDLRACRVGLRVDTQR